MSAKKKMSTWRSTTHFGSRSLHLTFHNINEAQRVGGFLPIGAFTEGCVDAQVRLGNLEMFHLDNGRSGELHFDVHQIQSGGMVIFLSRGNNKQ